MESSIIARHLIAEGDIENPTALRQPSAPAGQPTPVIIDCGRWAEVVVLPAAIFVGRGTRFRHRNVSFIIVGRRPGSGILVAEPAEH